MQEKEKFAPLIAYIERDIFLTEMEANLIASHCKEATFFKNELVLIEGDISKYAFFIVEGNARSYYINFMGKIITWLFHFNNESSNVKNLFMIDYKSFISAQPATISIETLSEVRAIKLSRESVEFLLNNCPGYERWTRKLNEKVFIVTYDRVNTLLTMSATDRYLNLLKDEGHLLQQFTNYQIASYLNVTPQSLSRIRKSLSTKKPSIVKSSKNH